MKELQAVAQHQDEEVDDLVYRISHDLRASVRALQELPNWLEEDLREQGVDIGEEENRTLWLISSHARRLDEMLNGLLSYSRVGRLQEVTTVQPQDVFANVVRELNPGSDIQFFTQFNPVKVRMGASDVARVFFVLLSNAIRHVKADPQKVEIVSCKSGDVWELLVSDNGAGIADMDKERIFRPMVKLMSRDEDEGGGMGLAILRKITDHYGGTVYVEDRLRRGGTTFRLRLPVLDPSELK